MSSATDFPRTQENPYCNIASDAARRTLIAGVPSAALGALGAKMVFNLSAAAGAAFGGIGVVAFMAVNTIMRIAKEQMKSAQWEKPTIDAFVKIALCASLLTIPLSGWALCAAAGVSLTALQITALTVSTLIGGALGIGIFSKS